ncbi:MAG: DUF2304 domain-containing protein [Kofleriaceae bacterium]
MIRVLLIGGFAAIGWLVFRRRNRLPLHILLVFLLLAAGAVAVVFPGLTTDVAHVLGVGRGADLVTYIAIVTIMFVLVHYYTKFVELQQQVTMLTRELAILRAEVDRVAPPSPSPVSEKPEGQDAQPS